MKVFDEVVSIIAEILEVQTTEITEYTAIGDISSWDSLRQLMIISKIEEHFKFQFDPEVLLELEEVNDIVAAVEERI